MIPNMSIWTCRRRFALESMTQEIMSEILMKMPKLVENWKNYSPDMKVILFNDFKVRIYCVNNIFNLYLMILRVRIYHFNIYINEFI